jgi:predicted nucleotidyltransferase component of viral defense system
MIKQKEITDIANRKKVPKSTIDKDWVLGHFLNAFYSFEAIRNYFVFKGGTCLHKCYIKDYRFSEDIDFTLLDKDFVVDKSFIKEVIKKAEAFSSIKFHLVSLQEQIHKDVPQGYLAELKFWGADHHPNQQPLPPSRWQTSIHIDISHTEKLFLPAEEKQIIHPYSDDEMINNTAICYNFKELLSEKIRALKQRNRPRDVYDVWHLHQKIDPDQLPELKKLLHQKTESKGLNIEGIEDFVNEDKAMKNKIAWDKSLSHQLSLSGLPSFDNIYQDLTIFMNTLLNVS